MKTPRHTIVQILKERGEGLLDHHGAEKLADEILDAIIKAKGGKPMFTTKSKAVLTAVQVCHAGMLECGDIEGGGIIALSDRQVEYLSDLLPLALEKQGWKFSRAERHQATSRQTLATLKECLHATEVHRKVIGRVRRCGKLPSRLASDIEDACEGMAITAAKLQNAMKGFPPTGKPKVVVEVLGGVAHTVYATMPMNVTIRDLDNIKAGDEDPLDGVDLHKSTEYQEVY